MDEGQLIREGASAAWHYMLFVQNQPANPELAISYYAKYKDRYFYILDRYPAERARYEWAINSALAGMGFILPLHIPWVGGR